MCHYTWWTCLGSQQRSWHWCLFGLPARVTDWHWWPHWVQSMEAWSRHSTQCGSTSLSCNITHEWKVRIVFIISFTFLILFVNQLLIHPFPNYIMNWHENFVTHSHSDKIFIPPKKNMWRVNRQYYSQVKIFPFRQQQHIQKKNKFSIFVLVL